MSVTELGVVDAAAVCSTLPSCPNVHIESDGKDIWASVQMGGLVGLQFAGGAEVGCCDVPLSALAARIRNDVVSDKTPARILPSPVAVLLEDGDVRLEVVDPGVFLPDATALDLKVAYAADDPILARLANGQTSLRVYHYQGDTWMAAVTLSQVFSWRVAAGTDLPETAWSKGPIDRIAQPDPQRTFGPWTLAPHSGVQMGWNPKWGIVTVWGAWFAQYDQRPLIEQDCDILDESYLEPPRINLSLPRSLLSGLDPSNCLRMREGLLTSLDACVWADILDPGIRADVFADMFLEVLPFLPGDAFDGYAQEGTLFLRGEHWRYRSRSMVSDAGEAKSLYDESDP